MSPQRIQRRRTKGYRLPPDAIYVGRPSRWGNPFSLDRGPEECCEWACYEDDGCLCNGCLTPEKATWLYREDLTEQLTGDFGPDLAPLRGHDLACWCPEQCDHEVALTGAAYGEIYDRCTKPTGHDGAHDPSAPMYCHADVLLELANR